MPQLDIYTFSSILIPSIIFFYFSLFAFKFYIFTQIEERKRVAFLISKYLKQ
jgi:hypothetical protein